MCAFCDVWWVHFFIVIRLIDFPKKQLFCLLSVWDEFCQILARLTTLCWCYYSKKDSSPQKYKKLSLRRFHPPGGGGANVKKSPGLIGLMVYHGCFYRFWTNATQPKRSSAWGDAISLQRVSKWWLENISNRAMVIIIGHRILLLVLLTPREEGGLEWKQQSLKNLLVRISSNSYP